MKLKKKEHEFVYWQRVARLATMQPDRRPHNIPICPILEDGKLYFASEDNRKVKNLRAEPRCSVVFDEYTEVWEELKQVMIEGRATRFLTKGAEFRKLRKAFYEKYMQYPTAGGGIDEDDTVIVEVTIDRAVSSGI